MVELRILANYGHHEILARLQKAQVVSCDKFTTISFVRVTFDPSLVKAVQELLTLHPHACPKKWDRVYFHRCQGLVNQVIEIVANANVDQFYFVGENPLSHATTTTVDSPFHILSMSTIRQVWFENVLLTKDLASMMAQSISNHFSLESFSLCNATVQADAVFDLANALASNRHGWKTIRLSHCHLDDDQLSCILLALLHCTKLSRLFVDGNQCREKSLTAISDLLKHERNSLATIDLSNQENGLPNELLSKLTLLLQTNTTVKKFKLQNNNLNDADLATISKLLIQNSTLTDLDLRFNAISSEALQQIIVPNMARYKGLQRLEIRSGVGVLRQGLLNALQESIQDNWMLQKLDIFEWDRRLEHFLDLNRSHRRILQEDSFSLSLWPRLLDRAMRTTERYIPSHLRGKKLAHSLASRKASILYYFLRNAPTLFVCHHSNPSMIH